MSGPPPDRDRPRLTVVRGGMRHFADRPASTAEALRPSAALQPRGAAPAVATRAGVASPDASARPDANGRVIVGVNALELAVNAGLLITYGLGSCIAVILYDPASRIGAMCHYMLADSAQDPRRAAGQPLMFGDLAIATLVTAFTRRGGNLASVEAFVVGGASLAGMSDLFDIGGRNTKMARATLDRFSIPVRGHETGGRASRTVSLDLKTGIIAIHTPGLAPRRLR